MIDNSSSAAIRHQDAAAISAPDERLARLREDLGARARRLFPELPQGQLAEFIESLAGHRAQEEERRAARR
jgi:hypothetical protein